MLVAHRIADVLERGPSNHVLGRPSHLAHLAKMIRSAEKFHFQSVPCPVVERTGFGTRVAIPDLERDEREMWWMGLLPLPAKLCWYEFMLGQSPVGILIESGEGLQFRWRRFDFVNGDLVFIPLRYKVLFDSMENWLEISKTGVEVETNNDELENNEIQKVAEADVPVTILIIWLTMMLHSRTTETEAVEPSRVVNRMAREKGRALRSGHTIVRIVPERFASETGRSSPGTGEGSPKRLHWRRSHLRHFDHPTLSSTYVERCVCCDRERMWLTAIPRHLVGRRELGEITHEYVVR